MTIPILRASEHLHDVRYEIRGALARRAEQLERAGHEIVKLNIGNPGAFGFRMPESMRVAIVQNLHQADPYSHQKGIFAAREAVVMQQQNRGVMDVTADDVFIGNGVSELIKPKNYNEGGVKPKYRTVASAVVWKRRQLGGRLTGL